jgi:hypothetical protein
MRSAVLNKLTGRVNGAEAPLPVNEIAKYSGFEKH